MKYDPELAKKIEDTVYGLLVDKGWDYISPTVTVGVTGALLKITALKALEIQEQVKSGDTYGIGFEDEHGDIGFTDGPTPFIDNLLDINPHPDYYRKKIFIFRLTEEGNIPTHRWNWAMNKWIELKSERR